MRIQTIAIPACQAVAIILIGGLTGGCATYSPVVKPVPQMSRLSPELENLTDQAIEIYLTADVQVAFPTVLAVAKVTPAPRYGDSDGRPFLDVIRGDEAAGWQTLAGSGANGTGGLIEQVQFLNALIVGDRPNLKTLREGTALLHASLLLVYMEAEDWQSGYNDAAMLYSTVVGLFCVPGNTVGHYTTCQGVLVDTRSGFILATLEGDAKREENVLPGAVDIASDRVTRQARAAAEQDLQARCRAALRDLAQRSSRPS